MRYEIEKAIKKIYKYSKLFIFTKKSVLYRGFSSVDLLIFDDIFPHPVSGFRLEEFTVLLQRFEKSKIVVAPTAYVVVNSNIKDHNRDCALFVKQFPNLKSKVRINKKFVNINTKLFYCIFIHNIFNNLHWLEKYKIPFVFTLYPGGGFKLNDIECDFKLRKVLSSPQFRQVIVTQKITRDYLVTNGFCSEENITFVFGGVVPQHSLVTNVVETKEEHTEQDTFNVCFCAAKYMPKGLDKGYDVFIEAALSLSKKYNKVRFHVIGGFDLDDLDVTRIKDKIVFYGYQNHESLKTIFDRMDVIVSPNKAFVLHKGAFDGFPLGTVIEAALNNVVVLMTDELEQNETFIPDVDFILIQSTAISIVEAVERLMTNDELAQRIKENSLQKFRTVYSNETQMNPRIAVLKKYI